MIELNNIGKRYDGGHEALNGLNLTVDDGEMVFLTGRSGAGKSTLLKLIMLMERQTSGQIFVRNQNLARVKGSQIAFHRRRIGVVFQNHQLF